MIDYSSYTGIAIGIGMVISLFLTETLGVTAGGIIVPGYIALYLHEPFDILITFFIALLVVVIIKGLSRYMFIYGKRRLVLSVLLGFLFGYISKNNLDITFDGLDISSIGNIIPGLITSWMDRQGVVKTISVIIIVAVIVRLSIMLISNGTFHV